MKRLGRYLSSLTKAELENLKEQLNLTDDEEMIFHHLSKGRSNVATADNCMVSLSFVDSRIRSIGSKLRRVGVVLGEING